MSQKEEALATRAHDPFTMLRRMTSELDRIFDLPAWPMLRVAPALRESSRWYPGIDVFERDKHLVTKIDLPGTRKEDVKVEVADGQLMISGERKTEAEEQKENYYRCEREYGSFFRSVPLPEGIRAEDVKATFTDGVLEVSVPLPVKAEPKPRVVQIDEGPKTAKPAA